MIEFVYDNDALEHLIKADDYKELKPRILESVERGINRFYICQYTFWEMVKGASRRNLTRLQNILREAYWLSGEGQVLLYPTPHLKHSLGAISVRDYKKNCQEFIRCIQEFLCCREFADFEHKFGSAQSFISDELKALSDLAVKGREVVFKNLSNTGTDGAKEFLSSTNSESFFRIFLPQIIERFKLESELSGLSADTVQRKVPSLRQFSDVFRTLQLKRLTGNKKIDLNDYFDVQKVVYLDKCDYLITDDRRLRVLFKEANCSDLWGRAIPMQKAKEHIKKRCLINRLTNPVYDHSCSVRVVTSE
ncbi:MAG: hypothetical protein OEW00_03515 [candidate division Zixibacteria bacterium]|nr:hypothetical protein [candidate division Zixibacteria bacterium]